MNLLTNGCSWTWGGGLGIVDSSLDDIRLSKVWPHHLGNLIGSDKTINISQGCGSNDRILRTTFDWLSSAETVKDTVAVIQWTDPSRYEYYVHSGSRFMENKKEQWALCKVDVVISPEPEPLQEKVKRSNTFLSTYTEIQGAYKMLFQVEALSSILSSYGVKYFYWSPSYNITQCPDFIKERLLSYNWIDYDENNERERWRYDRIPNDGHPSISGHEQLARIIYDKIKDRL